MWPSYDRIWFPGPYRLSKKYFHALDAELNGNAREVINTMYIYVLEIDINGTLIPDGDEVESSTMITEIPVRYRLAVQFFFFGT